MLHHSRKGIPTLGAIVGLAVIFVGYVGSAPFLHRWLGSSQHSAGSYVFLALGLPFVFAWLSYFLVLAASPYLRPRSLWREFGLAVLSFGAALFSWWCRVAVIGSIYGM
jgi:hypothetical protein